jgi:uncharacterized protein YcbK (DUF882 family)
LIEFKEGGIGDGRKKGKFIHVDVGTKRRWSY